MKLRLLLGLVVAAAAACSSPPPSWDGDVKRWGTLREVLRDGDKTGKVRLQEATASPHAVGIGALAGLEGEVLVFEGDVWTGRPADGGRVQIGRGATLVEEAAFLALAEVPRWVELRVPRTVDLDGLEAYLATFRPSQRETFPFVVESELVRLEAHVLNGRCPYAAEPGAGDPEGAEPVRRRAESTFGRLVGFYSEEPPGTLTHHDSRLHVHVALAGGTALVAHVDRVVVPAGASLYLPALADRERRERTR